MSAVVNECVRNVEARNWHRVRMPHSAPHTGLKRSKLTAGLQRSCSRLGAVNLLHLSTACAVVSETCFRHKRSCRSTMPQHYAATSHTKGVGPRRLTFVGDYGQDLSKTFLLFLKCYTAESENAQPYQHMRLWNSYNYTAKIWKLPNHTRDMVKKTASHKSPAVRSPPCKNGSRWHSQAEMNLFCCI